MSPKVPKWKSSLGYGAEDFQVPSSCSWTNTQTKAAAASTRYTHVCPMSTPSLVVRQVGQTSVPFYRQETKHLSFDNEKKRQEIHFLHLPTSQDIYVGEFYSLWTSTYLYSKSNSSLRIICLSKCVLVKKQNKKQKGQFCSWHCFIFNSCNIASALPFLSPSFISVVNYTIHTFFLYLSVPMTRLEAVWR